MRLTFRLKIVSYFKGQYGPPQTSTILGFIGVKMSRALVLSGGAFKGAIQVPVIEHLKKNYEYDAVYGVSIGAINGAMFAQDDLEALRAIWDDIDGLGNFLKLKWWWPFNGLYSMSPLRAQLESNLSLERLKMPFSAGIVSFTDGEYRNISSNTMTSDKIYCDMVQASSCMAGVMVPSFIEMDGEQHLGVDGGFRNIIPIPLDQTFDHLDVVACTQVDRFIQGNKFKKTDLLSLAGRTLQIFEDEIFDKDIAELIESNAEVRIFAPEEYPGNTLDASKEAIKFRYELGEKAIKNPLIFKHK